MRGTRQRVGKETNSTVNSPTAVLSLKQDIPKLFPRAHSPSHSVPLLVSHFHLLLRLSCLVPLTHKPGWCLLSTSQQTPFHRITHLSSHISHLIIQHAPLTSCLTGPEICPSASDSSTVPCCSACFLRPEAKRVDRPRGHQKLSAVKICSPIPQVQTFPIILFATPIQLAIWQAVDRFLSLRLLPATVAG